MKEVTNQAAPQRVELVRLPGIIGDKSKGIEGLCPVGKSTIYRWMEEGKFPKPIKLGERAAAWRVSDVLAFLEQRGV